MNCESKQICPPLMYVASSSPYLFFGSIVCFSLFPFVVSLLYGSLKMRLVSYDVAVGHLLTWIPRFPQPFDLLHQPLAGL